MAGGVARGPSAVGNVVLRHFIIAKLAHVLVGKLGQVFNDLPNERQNSYKQGNLLVLSPLPSFLCFLINKPCPPTTCSELGQFIKAQSTKRKKPSQNQMSIEPYKNMKA